MREYFKELKANIESINKSKISRLKTKSPHVKKIKKQKK